MDTYAEILLKNIKSLDLRLQLPNFGLLALALPAFQGSAHL